MARSRFHVVLTVVAVAAGLYVAVTPAPSWACSCVPMTDQERFDSAHVIFDGVPVGAPARDGNGNLVRQIDVEDTLKGEVSDPQAVSTSTSGSTFGVVFEESHRYRIFASRSPDGSVSTTSCSGTRQLPPVPDHTPPVSSFTTSSPAVLLAPPAGSDRVRGTAGDDSSGIRSVTVRWEIPGLFYAVFVPADLACTGTYGRWCSWSAPGPWFPGMPAAQPGVWTATVGAVDHAGNAASGPTITVVVV